MNPTSNHNGKAARHMARIVVYLMNPTSNHNNVLSFVTTRFVVYLMNPTSNHNKRVRTVICDALYIL